MKLRYINLGSIDPMLFDSLWEYSRIIIPECPTVFSFEPNKQTLLITNLYGLDKYFNIDKLPDPIAKVRIYIPSSSSGSGLFEPDDSVIFIYCFPKNIKRQELTRAIMAAKVKVLRKHGIETREVGNDLLLEKDGKFKKFAGFAFEKNIFNDNWITLGNFVSFGVNIELARQIFKIDTDKFLKKGIKDISDAIGGLRDVDPNIGMEIVPEIAQVLAKRFDLEFEEDNLTQEENTKILELADKLNNDEWKLYGRHPDIK